MWQGCGSDPQSAVNPHPALLPSRPAAASKELVMARKPRDFDAELQAFTDKAKSVKSQKTVQLGELVQVVGADILPMGHSPAHSSSPSSNQGNRLKPSRGGPNAGRASFSKRASGERKKDPAILLREWQTTTVQLQRLTVLRNRLDAARSRADTRDWVQDRRARTRHVIELGGLVQKAGLVELTDNDRAALLGAFLEIASWLQQDEPLGGESTGLLARWHRRGLHAFEADRAVTADQR